MALYIFLLLALDVIVALFALGILRALRPQKIERDIVRLEGEDVNIRNIADLSRLGYRTAVLRTNLAIMVGEFESERPTRYSGLRLSRV